MLATGKPCARAKRGTYLSNICWLVENFSARVHNYEVLFANQQACTVDIGPKKRDFSKKGGNVHDRAADFAIGFALAFDRKGETIYLNRANLREIRFETGQGMTCWSLSGKDVNGEGLDYINLCGLEIGHDRLNNAFSNLFAKYCTGVDSEF